MKKSILFIALVLVCSLSAKAEEKEVSCGSTVKIIATANPGYHFVQWNDGVTDASRTVTVDEAKSFTATFAHNDVTITVAVKDDKGGSVTINGEEVSSKSVEWNTNVELKAIPQDDCWEFVEWDDHNTANPRTVTATEAKTYTAIFKLKQIKVTATSNNDNWGTVTIAEN